MARLITIYFSGLFVPGLGFTATKYRYFALLPTIVGIVWVLTLSWSRLVTEKSGFIAMLAGLIVIHLAAYVIAIVLRRTETANSTLLASITSWFGCVLLFTSVVVLSHLNKEHWYGFSFYQIPSVSMSPTLVIGDVILVDTWAYNDDKIAIGDVVVFKRTVRSATLIKRVESTRIQNKDLELYVVGDNKDRSVDSRNFGWIRTDFVIGRSQFTWFNLGDLGLYR